MKGKCGNTKCVTYHARVRLKVEEPTKLKI